MPTSFSSLNYRFKLSKHPCMLDILQEFEQVAETWHRSVIFKIFFKRGVKINLLNASGNTPSVRKQLACKCRRHRLLVTRLDNVPEFEHVPAQWYALNINSNVNRKGWPLNVKESLFLILKTEILKSKKQDRAFPWNFKEVITSRRLRLVNLCLIMIHFQWPATYYSVTAIRHHSGN